MRGYISALLHFFLARWLNTKIKYEDDLRDTEQLVRELYLRIYDC